MRTVLITAIVGILLFAGCSGPVVDKTAIESMKDPLMVCILIRDSEYRSTLAGELAERCESSGYKAAVVPYTAAEFIDPADYGAVVFITPVWVGSPIGGYKEFVREHPDASNVISIFTAGTPSTVDTEKYDAVVTASNDADIHDVVDTVMERLFLLLG